ncbi:MAG: glycolate oxidase subunit GlcE [Candidatus Latescibacterota bacterium]|nr:glycolate oxidase subunit GlcE [Candidatus Latescibacterota bacterium]
MNHRPATIDAVCALVVETVAAGDALQLQGTGTKAGIGSRTSGRVVDLTALAGVVSYEPEELVLVVRPGTPLSEIEVLLAERDQQLAFEPPYWGKTATLGGTVACGWSGPRRLFAGSLRDFLLGAEYVDGRGRRIRVGGKVVKNVTGFDLWRLQAGAFGTLGILTEIVLKLWPRPATLSTVAVDLPITDAHPLMLEWARRPEAVSGIAYEPASQRLLVRVEGTAAAVAARCHSLAGLTELEVETLANEESLSVWQSVREATSMRTGAGSLWRIVLPASDTVAALQRLTELGLSAYLLDWGGALIWARMETGPKEIRAAIAGFGGMAWRFADDDDDPNPRGFDPLASGLATINQTVKQTIDPDDIFNRGRLGHSLESASS